MLPWYVTVQLKSPCAFCCRVWRFSNPVVAEKNLYYIDTSKSEPPFSEGTLCVSSGLQQICRTLHPCTGKMKFSSCSKDKFALYREAFLFVMREDIVVCSVGPYEVCSTPDLFSVMLYHFELAFSLEHNVVFIERKPTNSHVANKTLLLWYCNA